MASEKKITVKLLVDKEKSRVVFAESDKDFVDILFSFLTLPLGTVTRVLRKQSFLGCLDGLYETVENLDARYLQTEACKTMLLQPISAAALRCEDLVLSVDDTKPREFYTCSSFDCCNRTTRYYSSVPKARCTCGKTMHHVGERMKTGTTSEDGVFVKGGMRFIICDDLQVMPASVAVFISLIDKLGIHDTTMLDERNLDLGVEEVKTLLSKSLISKTPLTDLYFDKLNEATDQEADDEDLLVQPKDERNAVAESTKEIKVKLLLEGTHNKVVYLEVEEDFVDLLFSFLTFPLASVVKLLHGHSSIGSVDNLYKSAEDLGKLGNKYIKSEDCNKILLSPKLAPFFGCSQNMLKIDEQLSERYHGYMEVNPKFPVGRTDTGGGYAKGPGKFLVMDGLRVAPVSLLSAVQDLNEKKVPINSLVEREIEFGEAQALNLLKTALLSRNALSAVFSPNKVRKRRTYRG
uniref:Uncharacterized protein LOC105044094 n=1 Tax=Elaeis guineensis var. tenera TaxID=51953 RepID=A0A6I9R419_ELAGV|nr:uncharacterized protein LOC105044094 [Elaeis guineensis]